VVRGIYQRWNAAVYSTLLFLVCHACLRAADARINYTTPTAPMRLPSLYNPHHPSPLHTQPTRAKTPLQFIVRRRTRLLPRDAAHRRRPHIHPIHTLLLLDNLPDLVLLRARQHDQGAPIRSVPAVLPIFVSERDALTTAQPLAIGAQILVDGDLLDTREISHARVPTALFRLLRRLVEEAVLVRVLAAVLVDADALERAEDGIGAVVGGEVVGVLGQLAAVAVESALRGAELLARVGNTLGFGGVGVGVCEDTVLDEGDA
jgi:hypothetical protein